MTLASLPRPRPLAVLLGLVLVAGAASAQYKIVGPDGKVTYTDIPPAGQARPAAAGGTADAGGSGGLPYETRQAATRYPVTLYAAANCGPCDQARGWLKSRGVPFTEFSVNTDSDIRAFLARFNNDRTLPVIAVGPKTLHGYNPSEADTVVSAAGYPAQAKLSGYKWPAATPLAPPVARTEPEAPKAAAPAPKAPSTPEPPKSTIQF